MGCSMTSPLSPEAVAQMVADREAGTPGPWAYRPDKYDDWGTVKAGRFVLCRVRDPDALGEAILALHRDKGTDPWEVNARRIARLPYLESAYLTLAAENATLRASEAAANARADQARDAALVEAKAAVGLVRVPVGSTGPIWDAMDAIDALRDKPAPAQCCMCGKTDLSTVEGDGGPECQLDDGRWTCSHACYDRATEEPAPAVTVGGGLCGCCGERPIAYPSEGECIECFSANEGGEL